jgi:recombination protein RecR
VFPSSIQKLADIFSTFPTVGSRTARRFAFHLIRAKEEDVQELISSLQKLRENILLCTFCFNAFDRSEDWDREFCPVCKNARRDTTTICVVEKETDVATIEESKKYQGLYFVLGGLLSLRKSHKGLKRMEDLKARVENPEKFGITSKGIEEIILATDATVEGEATALFIEKNLKSLGKKVSRLGRGIPVGGELEYIDQETLQSAFEGRKSNS